MIRIGGLDSGKRRDQSCLVSVLAPTPQHEAFVEGVKFWPRGTEYQNIEDDVARFDIDHPFSRIMVEVNNVGEHVYEALLRRHGVAVRPVTTVAKLSGDRVKKSTASYLRRTMPKNEMVLYFLKLKKQHRVKFPAEPNQDMQQLIKQISAFSEKTTDAGNVRYGAPGSGHDDGVMALLMALFEARRLLEIPQTEHVGGPAFTGGRTIMETVTADDFR